MAGGVTGWSHQDDQFDWFSAYLSERGLQMTWRLVTFSFVMVYSAIPIVMLRSPFGPDNRLTTALAVFAAGCGAASALLWLFRWPTRRQSELFCAMATISIAAGCLSLSNPYSGLLGCTVFATIGGFAAYFHTLSTVLTNFAAAVACAAVLAYRLVAHTGDVALTGSSLLTVAALNFGVPFGILSLANVLRNDLRRSDYDALTGLLNRRAFHNSAYEMIMQQAETGSYLVVATIDLDDFKGLNDTQGHAVGDQALVAVSTTLRDNCGPTAVVGRAGGEEFVIADIAAAPKPTESVERIRQAIAATPFKITASIGTASAPVDPAAATASLDVITELIEASDDAMYEAKRAGGNQLKHRQLSTTSMQPEKRTVKR
ncbi:GGDEF domain-containing protein [Mycobacterium sp. CBMA293]|uniref:GGDEF domain-containing protein n=1 Tax=unclassified Mycolicibacterium TaxID=2636767 RepID=UPI0012DC01A0|nr:MULTISPECIES: GGDEF domain-containing protein [unclassified Mycolicibacterium]MUL48113.1 GGDEF domain-containing protein [Mycolicibacterium sp. CBMA 360]MUL58291.1 GGDEF domain-containing protein [Mycolicibacterium sp. CBMA 335]MUL73749.1 GGDEF domain-containing protein [Mycolicibacterium sp. CBMA 311]MUL93174.1 GGDEF domain-containing protein [Mycolicibacterium sp. CBMA 230]MUM07722.1 GGDEF domain-containing protein [Mycolicibacterium sp. CBMA 213]